MFSANEEAEGDNQRRGKRKPGENHIPATARRKRVIETLTGKAMRICICIVSRLLKPIQEPKRFLFCRNTGQPGMNSTNQSCNYIQSAVHVIKTHNYIGHKEIYSSLSRKFFLNVYIFVMISLRPSMNIRPSHGLQPIAYTAAAAAAYSTRE